MAKKTEGKPKQAKAEQESVPQKSFEERLERLEELGDEIRKNDIPLDAAIKAFEEGIKLTKTLEQDLEKIETRIEILVSGANVDSGETDEDDGSDTEATARVPDKPVFDLFDEE